MALTAHDGLMTLTYLPVCCVAVPSEREHTISFKVKM
jgi:hypothetical protein